MNFLNKMERKFGRFAIHNLTKYIIGCYIIGYIITYTSAIFALVYSSGWPRPLLWVLAAALLPGLAL
ncbi:MAG TPA: hypothetical protein H9809_09930, partial [Candidatus Blautia pullicola]|nr:hypothetical protein [Candidatus Blautia pullicola]